MTDAGQSSAQAPPLSVAQEALWNLSLLSPNQLTYNETVSIRKDGPLELPALRLAFNEIVRRHEAWRTTFEVIDGEPAQLVREAQDFKLPVIDLSHLNLEAAERQAVRKVAEASRVPYDIRRGSLIRPRLFRFPAEHHRLYLAMHHLIFDGVSLTRVILPELIALYDAYRAGQAPALAENRESYSDYARWEQQWITERRAKRRLEHWRERLTPPPTFALETEHPRPIETRLGGGAIPLSVPAQTVERLRAIGESTGATIFQVLAAGWSLLLSRYSGQTEVVFATAADTRQRPEFQHVVGCCVTPLVLRIDLSGEPSFTDLLVSVRNELLDSFDNLMPFERLVRELKLDTGSAANPVYQTMLVLEPMTAAVDATWSLHQIDSVLANAVGSFKLDLELQLDERSDGHISGQLIYDRDLFKPSAAERMVGHWLGLLHSIAEDPMAAVGSVPMLAAAELDRQLIEWNATAVQRPSGTVHELIKAQALERPEAIAITDGQRPVTYSEVERRAKNLATRLLAAGVKAGDVVALLCEPSIELFTGALGALKAGAAHLLLDPGLPTTALQHTLGDAGAAVILTQSTLPPELQEKTGQVLMLEETEQVELAGNPEAVAGDGGCCVQYTALPTGEQCGVLIGHAAVVNLAAAMAREVGIGPADTVLVLGQSLFTAPAIELWMALISGARIVLAPTALTGDGKAISQLIGAEQVTFLHGMPSVFQSLIETGLRAARGLKVLSGGEPLSRELAEQLLDRCRVLWSAYGTVQSTTYSTLARIQRSAQPTIGTPIANTRVYVVDRARAPVPVGVSGELLISGDGLAAGYLHQPELTMRDFVDDPFGPGVAYRTGDIARWLADGRLQLVDHGTAGNEPS